MAGKALHEQNLEKWTAIIQARKDSGETISRWCRENGINEKSYYRWQRIVTRKQADSEKKTQVKKAEFAEIICQRSAKESESAEITVASGKWTVNIRNNASPELVSMVLRAITNV